MSVGLYKKRGFERNLCLAKGLVKLGHEVTFLICNTKMAYRYESLDGVTVVAFPEVLPARMATGGLGIIDTLTRIVFLLPKDFDIVHVDLAHRASGGIPGYLYSWFRRVPLVCDWWDWVGKGGALDERSLLYRLTLGALDNYFEVAQKRSADGVITISRCLQSRAVSHGIAAEKTVIIHGGADVEGARFRNKREVRKELGLDPDAVIFGFAGMGPHEYSDLLPFFEALPELKRKYTKFHWFGTGDSLPPSTRKAYGMGDEYLEVGWLSIENYKKYLASADILLLLLKDDVVNRSRWPNKIGDYLVAGRPILTTNIGEMADFAERYPGSLNVVEWNKDSVIEEIDLLISDPLLMEDIGRRNIQIAIDHYSWDVKAVQFERFYLKTLERYKLKRDRDNSCR